MLGQRSDQLGLYQADQYYLDLVGRESFYGHIAANRHRLFRDEDFAMLYCHSNGRESVPPSLLAIALLLQAYEKLSDERATRSAKVDIAWKVAMGIDLEAVPFAKSTLQLFRAQLLIHGQAGAIFQASLEEAKRHGFLGKKKMTVAIDTTPIFGKGAVKDTYNLLAVGIKRLARAVAKSLDEEPETWAGSHDLSRYFTSSIKGEAAIDWDDKAQRDALLAAIVADARRLLEVARKRREQMHEGDALSEAIKQESALLCQLLAQDVEPDETGEPKLKDGVEKDRMPSATDPDMRHGRKSKSKRFEGHKASIAVDTDQGLITAVEVIPGNAPDNQEALELVEGSEENTGCEVAKTIGDCAYGDGGTRKAFAEAGRELVAKVPRRPHGQLSKDEFEIDLENHVVTCPAGHQATFPRASSGPEGCSRTAAYPAGICASCSLRPQCVKGKGGRTITIHPQEELLQAARAYQQTDDFRRDNLARQVVEHRIARLAQLGIRKSRFFGRTKTKFQLRMAAAVANLTLVWNAAAKRAQDSSSSLVSSGSDGAGEWLLGLQKRAPSGCRTTNWVPAGFLIARGSDPRILAPR